MFYNLIFSCTVFKNKIYVSHPSSFLQQNQNNDSKKCRAGQFFKLVIYLPIFYCCYNWPCLQSILQDVKYDIVQIYIVHCIFIQILKTMKYLQQLNTGKLIGNQKYKLACLILLQWKYRTISYWHKYYTPVKLLTYFWNT